MIQLVAGVGEVGSALMEVLGCDGFDVGETVTCDVLHVAFPWTPDFIAQVSQHSADLVVVHSTVPVGTCDPQGWVHSPVRGRHPHLVKSLQTFRKAFGGRRASAAAYDWPHDAVVLPRAAETEAGKLWELAQFGLQVRVTQAIYEWCEQHGLDPYPVYTLFGYDHNKGLEAMGQEQFIHPILQFVPGDIGGHCVTENMAHLDHTIARLVEKGL